MSRCSRPSIVPGPALNWSKMKRAASQQSRDSTRITLAKWIARRAKSWRNWGEISHLGRVKSCQSESAWFEIGCIALWTLKWRIRAFFTPEQIRGVWKSARKMDSAHNIGHGQMIVGSFKNQAEIARAAQLPGWLSGFKRAPVQEGGWVSQHTG